MTAKFDLLNRGAELMEEFCEANRLTPPLIVENRNPERFGTCAYYRPHEITISVVACAAIGMGGPAWSYPGYVIDRTPYGVVQHEMGHAVDVTASGETGMVYYGEFSVALRKASGEPKLTNYCPNDAEWFAEMMRLFITNSDLLKAVRPRTHELLAQYYRPVIDRPWSSVLADAPSRYHEQVRRKAAA
jgi:hypothetical protein